MMSSQPSASSKQRTGSEHIDPYSAAHIYYGTDAHHNPKKGHNRTSTFSSVRWANSLLMCSLLTMVVH